MQDRELHLQFSFFSVLDIIANGWGGGLMARAFAEDFYKSKAWRSARSAYIKFRVSVDGGMCEVCGERLGYIVHHKEWLTEDNIDDPDIALNPDNFSYECLKCHNKENPDNTKPKSSKRYEFTALGELMPLPPVPNKKKLSQ